MSETAALADHAGSELGIGIRPCQWTVVSQPWPLRLSGEDRQLLPDCRGDGVNVHLVVVGGLPLAVSLAGTRQAVNPYRRTNDRHK